MPTKRILLVASTTGYQTQMFAEAAKRIGFDLVFATDRCHVLSDPWGDQAVPIHFDDPAHAASDVARRLAVDGILALGDRPAEVAAGIAPRLGLSYNPLDAVAACRNKYEARRRFRNAGLPVPEFERFPLTADLTSIAGQVVYPCVLKPLGLSASRGVIRANGPEEFVAAFRRIAPLLHEPEIQHTREDQAQYIQVERFIPGDELALEGLLVRGQLRVLALFDKPDPLNGPFFEETIYVTPSQQPREVQQEISSTAESAARALGLREGPVHAEMRVSNEGVWMLEVAARPIGGLCARVLPDLPELLLRHAAGEDVSGLIQPASPAGVMMIPIPRSGVYQNVSGAGKACCVSGIEDVVITAKPGQKLEQLPEGRSYLGFIFARGDNAAFVEKALRTAHAQLEFEILGTLPVMRS